MRRGAYKAGLLRGEIGLQRPGKVSEGGTDFISAVEDPVTGLYDIVITDVKTSVAGEFPTSATGIPITWGDEVRDALARLDLGDPALEAQIWDAFEQGRVFPRQLNVDYSAAGQGAVSGWDYR